MRYAWKFDWLAVLVAAITTRLIPFFMHGPHPLGYDTGFYRHYVAQIPPSFPGHISEGLRTDALIPRLALDMARMAGASPDIVIYGTLIAAFSCAALAFQYVIGKRLGKEAGFFAGLLFVFSSIQYGGYWFFLLKNYIGLILLFLIYGELEKISANKNEGDAKRSLLRKYLPLLGYMTALFFSHTTTSIMLISTMTVFWGVNLCEKKFRKEYILPIAICMGGIMAYIARSGILYKIGWHTTAIFLSWEEYLEVALPVLIFSAFMLRKAWQGRDTTPFFSLLAVSGAFTLLRLPFYERIFLFLDIATIALCAEGIAKARKAFDIGGYGKKIAMISFAAIFSGWYLGNFSWMVKKYVPMMTAEEIAEVRKIDGLTEKDATILTVSDYMPWIYGFTTRKTISPGLREYTYDLEDWQRFWFEMSEKERIGFLKVFPKPLYFFTMPGSDDNFLEAECIKKKTEYLRSFECA